MKSTKSNKSSNWRKQSLTAYIPMPKGRGLTPHLIKMSIKAANCPKFQLVQILHKLRITKNPKD